MDPRSGETSLVLSAPGSQTNAETSPDGRRVVYESRVPGVPPQIFVLEADGTKRRLTRMEGGAFDPTWSPDGTQIAFAGTPAGGVGPRFDSDIFVMNADGRHIRRLVGTARPDGHPDWSPDGSRIAFHSRSGWTRSDLQVPIGLIWVVSVRTRTLGRLTPSHFPYGEVDPAWSPNGRWIAFSRFPRSTINGLIAWSGLWVMRSDGTSRRGIRTSDKKSYAFDFVEDPSWSPNGGSIVVDSRGNAGIIDVATERRRAVLTDATEADWSPEGILVDSSGAGTVPSLDAAWSADWEPTWLGRPDATIALTGSRCQQRGDAREFDPGPLVLSFANEAHLDGLFRVARLAPGQRLRDLWDDVLPFIGRRSSVSLRPSRTKAWSSRREVTSGRWAVLCWKDLISAPNGFQMDRVGIVGPFEVGS